MILPIVLILIIALLVVVCILLSKNNSDTQKALSKGLFSECTNNFDCSLGFHCELRSHPSKGICVIPPGGNCHSKNITDSSLCYSGYYCDKDEGVCMRKEA